ncbi:hypothetical protein EV714DRAFT_272420 [Schizophyllum commune]
MVVPVLATPAKMGMVTTAPAGNDNREGKDLEGESTLWSGAGEDESSEEEPEDEGSEIRYGPSIEVWAMDVWESIQEEGMSPPPSDETLIVAPETVKVEPFEPGLVTASVPT